MMSYVGRSAADIRTSGNSRVIVEWISAVGNVAERTGIFVVRYGAERIGYPLLRIVADCHGADIRRYKNHGTVRFDRTAPYTNALRICSRPVHILEIDWGTV